MATYVYHRCECGAEWTESRPCLDRTQPVTTDEVLEVHAFLDHFEGSISQLIEVRPEPKPES